MQTVKSLPSTVRVVFSFITLQKFVSITKLNSKSLVIVDEKGTPGKETEKTHRL